MGRGLDPTQIPRTKPGYVPVIPRLTPTPTGDRDLCRYFAPYNQKYGLSKGQHWVFDGSGASRGLGPIQIPRNLRAT
jgi:hypothetical protein